MSASSPRAAFSFSAERRSIAFTWPGAGRTPARVEVERAGACGGSISGGVWGRGGGYLRRHALRVLLLRDLLEEQVEEVQGAVHLERHAGDRHDQERRVLAAQHQQRVHHLERADGVREEVRCRRVGLENVEAELGEHGDEHELPQTDVAAAHDPDVVTDLDTVLVDGAHARRARRA